MDTNQQYSNLLNQLIASYRTENRHLEFKSNYQDSEKLGRYISALSNGACLDNVAYGYLFFGVRDNDLSIIGTTFDATQITHKGHQNLELFLRVSISPRVDFQIIPFTHTSGARLVVIQIPAAKGEPTCFCSLPYVRINSQTTSMSNYPAMMRAVYNSATDWTKEIIPEASIKDLDEEAISIARSGYVQRFPDKAEVSRSWSDEVFLDKAKITIDGRITRTAILLLGKDTSAHYLGGMREIDWRLQIAGEPPVAKPFGLPFITATSKVKACIRNYNIKIFPDTWLIPAEVQKYDDRSIMEGMHNCIAHQDYTMGKRIVVTEESDKIIFESAGSFYEGSPDTYIEGKVTPQGYRNPFLVQAMVNLKMIDTQGFGISEMYERQKERFLPMPNYDRSTVDTVVLEIPGNVINLEYSLALMKRNDLDITTTVLLDRVQRGQSSQLPAEAIRYLRKKKLIEGRKPNFYISKSIAEALGKEADYVNMRGLDDEYYCDLIKKALATHHTLKRNDFNKLLIGKLPNSLSEDQKIKKVSNLLSKLKHKGDIYVDSERNWHLV